MSEGKNLGGDLAPPAFKHSPLLQGPLGGSEAAEFAAP